MLTQEFVLSSDLVEHGDSDPYILRILLKFVKHFGTNASRELSNFQRYIIKLWYKNVTCTKCSSLYEPEVFMGQLSINDNIAVSMNFQSRGFEAPQDPIEMFLTSQWRSPPLRWRHNDQDGVSNHQPHGCLLNRLFRRRSNKTSKLRNTGLCVGNSPVPVNSPHKGPVTRKMLPFDDVIMAKSTSRGQDSGGVTAYLTPGNRLNLSEEML